MRRAFVAVAAVGVLVMGGLAGWADSGGAVANAPVAHLVINEVDYDNVGTDTQEFVEIFNGTGKSVPLADYAVVLVNGGSNREYSRTMLAAAGTCLAAGRYLVIADEAVVPDPNALVIRFPGARDQIQNGQPDGVALINTSTHTLVDALSYEGSITKAQIDGFTGLVSLVEGTPTPLGDSNTVKVSLSREPNSTDTENAESDWALDDPTPGFANAPSGRSHGGSARWLPASATAASSTAATTTTTATSASTSTSPAPPPPPPPLPPPPFHIHLHRHPLPSPAVLRPDPGAAKRRIRARGCDVGRVAAAFEASGPNGHRAKPSPGTVRPAGFAVKLVVGRR